MTVANIGWVPDFLFFMLLPLLFVGGLVVLAVYLLTSRDSKRPSSGSPALRLLEERYARGEITRDEFIERRDVLRGQSG